MHSSEVAHVSDVDGLDDPSRTPPPRPGRVRRSDGAHVRYVEDKPVDYARVAEFLSESQAANQWSNFGPVCRRLERAIRERLALPPSLRVVMCASGSQALHGIVALQETLSGRSLRWTTSSFGFYCAIQGPLREAKVVDCDERSMLDLAQLDPKGFDGFIVTNVFGMATDLTAYREFARRYDKIMVVDAALSFGSHEHGPNECISFHHTKPWGFGEGGCAIVLTEHEALFRSLIALGHEPGEDINRRATNAKASDVACAFQLMRLEQMPALEASYRYQYERMVQIGDSLGLEPLGGLTQHPAIPGNVPLLLPHPVEDFRHPSLPTGRYYHPLAETPNARAIHDRIINVPCHPGMTLLQDGEIAAALLDIRTRLA